MKSLGVIKKEIRSSIISCVHHLGAYIGLNEDAGTGVRHLLLK